MKGSIRFIVMSALWSIYVRWSLVFDLIFIIIWMYTQTPSLPSCYWISCIWLYMFGVAQLRDRRIEATVCARAILELLYWSTHLFDNNGPGVLWAFNSSLLFIWVVATYYPDLIVSYRT